MPTFNPATGTWDTGAAAGGLQGGATTQGSTLLTQGPTNNPQLTVNGNDLNQSGQAPVAPQGDQNAQLAAQQAAALARLAAARGDISSRANQIKSIYDSRYGKVDQLAQEQSQKLNDRFGNESGDILKQVDNQNQQIGAAHAAAGTYDSSYRGNNVDTVTNTGKSQIRDLGTELNDNLANVGKWIVGQKAGINAQKSQYDNLIANLSKETDVNNLISTRNQLDAKIAELNASEGDYNTSGQNAQALNTVAPANSRSVKLQSNLQTILGGNSDPGMKLAIGQALISNSGLDPADQQKMLLAFQSDVNTSQDQKDQTQQA